MRQYYMPVHIISGADCVLENRQLFLNFGKKALIVTGKHSAKICGALDDVTGALTQNGQIYEIYDGITSNPTVDSVYEGAQLAKSVHADFIIAIGGGSPMDAAKAIALLAVSDIPREAIFNGVSAYPALPMAHIATTAGTGSEVTPYAILTNDAKETKTSISAPSLFPKYAFLDARYLRKLPQSAMNHTVLDSLSHSMEGMLSVRASALTDGMALHAMKMIGNHFPALQKGSLTDEAMEDLLHASTLGGMVIANTGTTVVHSMGYSLTYFHGADHGRANGLLLPAFLKIAMRYRPDRIREMLEAMGLLDLDDLREQIDALLGEREHLSTEQIEKYTKLAAGSKNIKNCCIPISETDIRDMFTESLGDRR